MSPRFFVYLFFSGERNQRRGAERATTMVRWKRGDRFFVYLRILRIHTSSRQVLLASPPTTSDCLKGHPTNKSISSIVEEKSDKTRIYRRVLKWHKTPFSRNKGSTGNPLMILWCVHGGRQHPDTWRCQCVQWFQSQLTVTRQTERRKRNKRTRAIRKISSFRTGPFCEHAPHTTCGHKDEFDRHTTDVLMGKLPSPTLARSCASRIASYHGHLMGGPQL